MSSAEVTLPTKEDQKKDLWITPQIIIVLPFAVLTTRLCLWTFVTQDVQELASPIVHVQRRSQASMRFTTTRVQWTTTATTCSSSIRSTSSPFPSWWPQPPWGLAGTLHWWEVSTRGTAMTPRHHVGAGGYILAGISSLASFGWTITRQSMQTSWRQRRMSVLWQRCHEGKLLFCHDGVHSACFSLWNIIIRFWERSDFI